MFFDNLYEEVLLEPALNGSNSLKVSFLFVMLLFFQPILTQNPNPSPINEICKKFGLFMFDSLIKFGTPYRIRTCNPIIRSDVLYPVELMALNGNQRLLYHRIDILAK